MIENRQFFKQSRKSPEPVSKFPDLLESFLLFLEKFPYLLGHPFLPPQPGPTGLFSTIGPLLEPRIPRTPAHFLLLVHFSSQSPCSLATTFYYQSTFRMVALSAFPYCSPSRPSTTIRRNRFANRLSLPLPACTRSFQ